MQSVHTYMSYEAHAWSLFGSIQALHPTCPGIVLNPRQRHIAHPSQDRDPATNVSISILPLGDSTHVKASERGRLTAMAAWNQGEWKTVEGRSVVERKAPIPNNAHPRLFAANRSSALIRPCLFWFLVMISARGRALTQHPVFQPYGNYCRKLPYRIM